MTCISQKVPDNTAMCYLGHFYFQILSSRQVFAEDIANRSVFFQLLHDLIAQLLYIPKTVLILWMNRAQQDPLSAFCDLTFCRCHEPALQLQSAIIRVNRSGVHMNDALQLLFLKAQIVAQVKRIQAGMDDAERTGQLSCIKRRYASVSSIPALRMIISILVILPSVSVLRGGPPRGRSGPPAGSAPPQPPAEYR